MKKSIDFKRDFLVVIGKRANEFATKHKAHVIFSHDKKRRRVFSKNSSKVFTKLFKNKWISQFKFCN